MFSNSNDRFHSQIIAVDPKTGASRDLFAGTGPGFDRRAVREYNNIPNEDYNAPVLYAEQLEPGYLASVPTCVK